MGRGPSARIVATVVALLAGGAGAQVQPQPPVPVDPGTADRGPGSVGLRRLPPMVRTPTRFESIFEIQRREPFAAEGMRTSTFFMRAEGGVTAVFPRSVYTESGAAAVPPGTIFYLGELPAQFRPPHPDGPRAPNWLNLSYEAAAKERERSFFSRREPLPPARRHTIFEDEQYRQRRVERLLNEALEQGAP